MKNHIYKITLTITSTTDRYIDIVTKAPNNNYGARHAQHHRSHRPAPLDYEMVFTANQSGAPFEHHDRHRRRHDRSLARDDSNSRTSNFRKDRSTTFTKNSPASSTTTTSPSAPMMDYITGTDADFVREFYYWDQASGNILVR
ncbi:MAG: hypothetical protein MZU97_24515 [Bacillus subtilis]|nr:hypothetical protein [Bacillus subtilis]